MFALTFDETFLTAVAVSSILMVLSAAWIVLVLCNIEQTKVVVFSTVLDEDDGTGNDDNCGGGGGGGDLQFEESSTTAGQRQLELEPKSVDAKQNTKKDGTVDEITTKSRSPTRRERGVVTPSSPTSMKNRNKRKRRVSRMFLGIQIISVSVLILLTYLLLVVSSAPIALRILGSLCVFAMFLRYQIGDEVRRQRVDRIMLLLSLFLLIASMLSTLVYSMKSLSQGEIYEGAARVVGYDMEQYNNSQHDPTTRTDIAVSWGRDWGCPLSGGKVCQHNIEGAMCQTHPDKEQTKHKPNYDNNRLLKKEDDDDDDSKSKEEEEEEEEEEVEDLEEDLEDEEDSNQDLESENESLEEENEELKEEIEELQEENEIEEEEEDEIVAEENSELDEIVDEYDEDIMIVEEEEYEDAQAYVDAEYEMDEESIEEKIDSTDDDLAKEELEEEIEDDEDDLEELDEAYEEDEEYFDEYADEFSEDSEEEYEELEEEIEIVDEEEDEKDEMNKEIDETETKISDTDKKIGHKDSTNEEQDEEESNDDVYEEMAEEVYEEEEEEIEEEYEEEEYDNDYWYWDEYPDSYDDDFYEDEYWSYDWDNVWGDYACEDLFDSDVGSKTYDMNTPAGEDDWPIINIYGSCKTCEAFILDYFAEEAFEEVLEYKQQAIVYLAGAMAGFIWAALSYVKYRVMPTAENEIELLGGDGGVMA